MKVDVSNAIPIREVIIKLEVVFALNLNNAKCKVFFEGGVEFKDDIMDVLDISPVELPIKYLGMNLSCVNLRDSHCNSLVDEIKGRIERWK